MISLRLMLRFLGVQAVNKPNGSHGTSSEKALLGGVE